jgi:hypothetical protein
MYYGPEQMWPNAVCNSGETCSISSGQSTSFSYTWTINGGISISSAKRDLHFNKFSKRDDSSSLLDMVKASVNLGVSYSWSKSYTYSATQGFSWDASVRGCGYWTFVPYMVS